MGTLRELSIPSIAAKGIAAQGDIYSGKMTFINFLPLFQSQILY